MNIRTLSELREIYGSASDRAVDLPPLAIPDGELGLFSLR
jgi:hypothetical protein